MLRFIGWMAATACVIAGCEGKHRPYALLPLQVQTTDAGSASGTSGAQAATGRDETAGDLPLGQGNGADSLGASCGTSADCVSGFCVDGVCCRSSCDAVCSRCDGPGTAGECTVAANDVACGLSCPASTECRSYGSGALTANCEAVGLCRTLEDCRATDAPAGTACERGAGECNGQGECIVVGKKRLGEPCVADEECAEGNCVVGSGGAAICCDAECAGLCQTCSAAGRCNEIPRDDARCANVDCPEDNLCRDYTDDIDVNLCRGFAQCKTIADCTFAELRSGAQCSCGAGGCTLTVGSACTNASECASSACEATPSGNQVCCVQACGAQGLSCSPDGSRCVQCERDGVQCEGNVSRVCANGALVAQTCGNGCDAATGQCTAQRVTGSVCDLAAQCQSGVCTLDVTGTQRCCDASCVASGRACGADGSCVCPAGSEAVGGACRLRAGQTCALGSDCASGACIAKVGGDSVCCAQACGSFCAADGSACVECEGAASTCQGNTSARCQDGNLVNSQCGNGCNAATGVCNGLLPNGQACTAGAQCASTSCAADLNGAQRCCTPNCAASGRVCGVDGACVCPNQGEVFINGACRRVEGQACGSDSDCRSGACEPTQGGAQVCCSGACNSQICRANGQGCVACEGNASTCQGNGSRSCVNNAFVPTTCANGCNAGTGLCNNLIQRGGTGCSSNAQCAGNGASCQGTRCCEFDCASAGRSCAANGLCTCPPNTALIGNACLLVNGQLCSVAADCASGRCDTWFRDTDGDLHGDPRTATHICGSAGAAAPTGFVPSSDDCCDSDALANPGQTRFQPVANACGSFDYNCDGELQNSFEDGIRFLGMSCNRISVADCAGGLTLWLLPVGVPACGSTGSISACQVMSPGGGLPTQCFTVTGAGGVVNQCL